MSLNGLDSDVVTRAHQTALAEAGGWFLLHYISRDTVVLLGQGSEGVSELRKTVESYEEKSPLYGVAQYRRKKFILKYVPEGTSRLLQVRLAVQFQSILDTFTPYDAVFSFVAAHELSESAFALSTILQSSAASRSSKSSSSSSLRQQRLNDITEDLEEPPITRTVNASAMACLTERAQETENSYADQLPQSATRAKALLAKHKQKWEQELADKNPHLSASTVGTAQLLFNPSLDLNTSVRANSIATNKELPVPPPDLLSASPTQTSTAHLRPSFEFPVPQPESDSDDDVRRPVPKQHPQMRYSAHLSTAESNSISQWSDNVLASTATSKNKRAPKATADLQVRPKTSGNTDDAKPSRRANLPTTVRVARTSDQSSRPGSRQSSRSVPARFVPTPDLAPPMPLPTIMAVPRRGPPPVRPNTSQGTSYTYDVPGITPEKMRLMKALQMRKRTQLLTQRCNTAPPETTNTLASINSFQSIRSDLSAADSAPLLSRMITREPLFQVPELTIEHELPRTSPTSVVTASDNHSTKPSSISNDSLRNGSRTSLSSETGSSSTPKAESGNPQHQEINKDKPIETVPHPLTKLPPGLHADKLVVDKAEDEGRVNRPLTYHCATADFLADIEEEERTLPVPIFEAIENTPSTGIPEVKEQQSTIILEAPVEMPPQNANTSDESDDESLIEELQNATVHEAKPMSVHRTPATPVLSSASSRTSTYELSSEPPSANSDRSLSKRPMRNSSRTPSSDSQMSPPDLKRAPSRAGSTRSLSTALPQWPPPPMESIPALPKQRPIVGIGISKRVKTFEGLSQRDSLTLTPPQKDPLPRTTSLSSILKRASVLYSHGDNMSEKSIPRPIPSPLRTDFDSSEHESSPSRPWLQRPGTSTEVYSPIHKGETVSVTAHIVRDPIKPTLAHSTSGTTRTMHASPLIVEHEIGSNLELPPPFTREFSTQSMDSLATSASPSERRRFSFSSHKTGSQKLSPVESKSLISFATHKKMPKSPTEASPTVDEKKQSRTSRMLKRLSGIGKTRSQRDLTSSPTRDTQPDIVEEPIEVQTEIQAESKPQQTRHVVDIGEVNVQFAETLLWKRRFLRVDDQGFLIFAPPSNDFGARGISRKIHLDELHKPSLPDHERQEMAWSIVLDLKSGGTVQCACESKSAQRSVLKMLLDAHNAYHQLYG